MKRWLSLSLLGCCAAFGVSAQAVAQNSGSHSALGSDWDPGALACVMEPKAVVRLGSSEEGILREILAERGGLVTAGQIVARLDSELEKVSAELARVRAESQVDVESSRARLKFRQSEAARMEELHTKAIVSTKSMDEAAVERRLAEFAVKSAELEKRTARLEYRHAQARLDRRNIRSPVDGVVVERNMAVGEFAHEQSPVMTIAQIDPLNVEVFVPIGLYGSVAVGMPAEVEPEAPIGGSYRARVTVVDRVFDTASGTFGVRLALPNPEGRLPAGLKCQVRFLPMETAEAQPPEGEASGVEPAGQSSAKLSAASVGDPSALISDIQRLLQRAGYNPGQPDGQLGPRTRKAIEAFQRKLGLTIDGQPSPALKSKLEDLSDRRPEAKPAPEAPEPEETASTAAAEAPREDSAAAAGKGTGWYRKFQEASKAMERGATEDALALYSEALDSGRLPASYQVLALSLRSSLHDKAGRPVEAIADLDRALRVKPENPRALAQRGNIYLKQRRFGRAVEDYDAALVLDPAMVEAYYGRALAQSLLGEHRRAIEDYDRISSLDPNFSAAYFNRAAAYERLGERERAARDYAALYALEPDYPGLKARMQQLGLLQP